MFESNIDNLANHAATSPTNNHPLPTFAQREAGNYKKGHVTVQGLNIAIENPKGSIRSGVDANGKVWETKMQNHYGDIKATLGADGDPVDVFLGDNLDAPNVFIVDQVDPLTLKFDEHKTLIGFNSENEAKEAYLANYQDDWKGLRSISTLSVSDFKQWLSEGNLKQESRKAGVTHTMYESADRYALINNAPTFESLMIALDEVTTPKELDLQAVADSVITIDDMKAITQKALSKAAIKIPDKVLTKQFGYKSGKHTNKAIAKIMDALNEVRNKKNDQTRKELAKLDSSAKGYVTTYNGIVDQLNASLDKLIADSVKGLGTVVTPILNERVKTLHKTGILKLNDIPHLIAKEAVKSIKKNYTAAGKQIHKKIKSEILDKSAINRDTAYELAESADVYSGAWRKLNKKMKLDYVGVLADVHHLAGGTMTSFHRLIYNDSRASANTSGYINVGRGLDRSILYHEAFHHVEYSNESVFKAAKDLLIKRYEECGKVIKPLNDLSSAKYDEDEMAIDDGFIDYYVGKLCRSKTIEDVKATEIMSMGGEHLSSPELTGKLAAADPEHLHVVLGALKGLSMGK